MLTIDISQEVAERALMGIAAHVPPPVDIGRPVVALQDGLAIVVITAAATWWLVPGAAERVVALQHGRSEVTRWCDGVELSRVISGR